MFDYHQTTVGARHTTAGDRERGLPSWTPLAYHDPYQDPPDPASAALNPDAGLPSIGEDPDMINPLPHAHPVGPVAFDYPFSPAVDSFAPSRWSFEANSPDPALLPSIATPVHSLTILTAPDPTSQSARPNPEFNPAPTKEQQPPRVAATATAAATSPSTSSNNNPKGSIPNKEKPPVRLRRTHNHNEKQYRTRLNASFDRLLAVCDPQGDDTSTLANMNRMSKAEVLQVATARIVELREENARLRGELERLGYGI